jgi:hypothetical protein
MVLMRGVFVKLIDTYDDELVGKLGLTRGFPSDITT